jgi:sacsin
VDAGAHQLRFVHPQLGAVPRVCVGLGGPSLGDVVVETLTAPADVTAAQLPALRGPDGTELTAERVATRIAAPEVLAAAHAVIASSTIGADLSFDDIAAAFRAVAGRLLFVPHLTVAVNVRATAGDARAPEVGRPFFDDPLSGKLLVAQPGPHAAPADVIAAALSDVLCLPAPLPLAPLLTCQDAALQAVAQDLCDMCVVPSGGSSTTGPVGLVVTPAHEALTQFRPLRPFREGEICAWRPPAPVLAPAEAARAAALARATAGGQPPVAQQAALRYVRVVADAAVRPGAVVFPVTVETAPGETRALLSTEVLSFRGSATAGARRGEEAAAMEHSPASVQVATIGMPPQPVLHASDAARAVRDLLAAADLPLDLDRDTLLQKTLDMQARLRQAEAAAATAAAAAEAATAESEAVCRTLICPITHALMEDPVMLSDGHTYERASIRHWLASANTSPVTNRQLSDRTLLPNHTVKAAVAALKERQRRAQATTA